MLEETRLHRICALLSTLNEVSTELIIKHLGVSRETVRRDVLKLEAKGRLRRVHGGVISCDFTPEAPLSIRNNLQEQEKRVIADLTVSQLYAGQTLFIDSGSTTYFLAESLLSMSGLTIITNSLDIASKLSSNNENSPLMHEVILLGGYMGKTSQATSGDITVNELRSYHADVALLSPVGISSDIGASSYFHHEATIANAMVRNAKSTYILADSSKCGIKSRMVYASPSEIDLVILGSEPENVTELELMKNKFKKIIIP